LFRQHFFLKDTSHTFVTVLLLLLFVFLYPNLAVAQDTEQDSLSISRLDSLNKRRLSPSFLLWPNLQTSPLYPNQNPYRSLYSPFYPSPSLQQKIQVEMDSTLKYRIQDQLDTAASTPGVIYDFDDFSKIQEFKVRQEYWRSRSRGMDGESPVTGRDITMPVTSTPGFDRIFGGDEISIVPSGFVNLDLGAIFRRIDNPAIPIRQQQNGNFNFNQQIQMAVNGNLGQKMRLSANFDSNNSFDFQNQLKVEYNGFREDIIKSIEIGNVSMPVQNSLIQGAQNLFGVKTQMQFGNMFVTAVAST